MAMVIVGKTNCSLCGRVLADGDDFVSTTHFIADETDPFWRYSDSGMHRPCFLDWEHRNAFAEKYNAIVGKHVAIDGTRYWMQPDGTIAVEQVGPAIRGAGQPSDATNILGELDDRRIGTFLTQREQAKLVRDSLATGFGDLAWTETIHEPPPGHPLAAPEHWFTLLSPHLSFPQRLVLDLRRDGDLQLEHHFRSQGRGPLEKFWLLRPPDELDTIRRAVQFAADIVAEAAVLVRRRRLLGRYLEHMALSEIPSGRRAGIEWVRSWRGTHDSGKT